MNGKFNPKNTIRALVFSVFKTAGNKSPLPPSCPPLSVSEYASIPLNMPTYPWKCLNKLLWIRQRTGYAWSSCIFDRLLKKPRVLNNPKFWICIQGLRRVPNMSNYGSIRLNNAWICLNVPKYACTWQNIAECPWVYAWQNCWGYSYNMPRYSYNSIMSL